MKKTAFLLTLVILFTFIAASCGGGDESSYAESSDAGAESSDTNSEKTYYTGVSVSSDPVERFISAGASYTKSVEAGEAYPDTYGTELTDGVFADPEAASYTDEAFSGYNIAGKRLYVVMDLGFSYDRIYAFRVSYLSTSEAGIGIPSNTFVYVSQDGENWNGIGTAKGFVHEEGTVQTAELRLDEYIKARYVRFGISGAAAWTFFDELMVIGDYDQTDATAKYADWIENISSRYRGGKLPTEEFIAPVDRTLNRVSVTKGKKYTISGELDSSFPDTGNSMLTDGSLSGIYEGKTWVGFKTEEDTTITVDLGTAVSDIAGFEVSCYTNTNVSQYLPVGVRFTVIYDSVPTDVGVVYGSPNVVKGNYTFSIPLEKTLRADKIEFTLIGCHISTKFLVEEVNAYAYRADAANGLYPEIRFVSEDTAKPTGDNSEKNLIAGKTQQILASSDPGEAFYENNTPVTSGLLTDGKKSERTDIHSGEFFKFNGGGGRVVIYDLGFVSAVNRFTAGFTNQTDWAVTSPSVATVYVTTDTDNWYEVGNIDLSAGGDPGIHRGTLKLGRSVKARYVAFSFAVAQWAGCDELEIFGTENGASGAEPAAAGYKTGSLFVNKRKAPSKDLLGGSKDLCLLYHGKHLNGYTVEELIPYLAYIDTDGNPVDTMFDSFLFLLSGNLPSGAAPYGNGTKADWEWTIQDIFKEGKNMLALEEAAGIVKEKLGLPSDYKFKVTTSIYYPDTEMTSFGDVDGDGNTENFTVFADRIKAVKWYIQSFEKKFSESGFQNIELVGYYWFHEEMKKSEEDNIKLLNAVADEVHAVGRSFFWIPYFTSNGYNNWEQLGFDIANMQPNYVFNLTTSYKNIIQCAQLTKLYGMGVEIEVSDEALSNILIFKKYMQYLAAGIEYGYMTDSVHMYYQGVYAYEKAARSKTSMGRMVYDATYKFIKGTLEYSPEKLDAIEISQHSSEYIVKGRIETGSTLSEYRIEQYPEHGSVTINPDGTFTYYSEAGYTGAVTFKYSYSNYLGFSEPCEIIINIT